MPTLALFRALLKVGMATAIRMAMMATTISISIRVKPFLLVNFLSIVMLLLFYEFIYIVPRWVDAQENTEITYRCTC